MKAKVCATVMVCELRDRCKLSPKFVKDGLMHRQFFVPQRVGEHCDHYKPLGDDSYDND